VVKILRGIGRALAWFNGWFNRRYDDAHPDQRYRLEQIEAAELEASGPGTHEEGK
jgi:hypothetical protein